MMTVIAATALEKASSPALGRPETMSSTTHAMVRVATKVAALARDVMSPTQ